MSLPTYYLEHGRHVARLHRHCRRARPRAIPLAMITVRKSIHGFPLLSMGMGLPFQASATGAQLLLIIFQISRLVCWSPIGDFHQPNIFSTRHGDQNGHSLEHCTVEEASEMPEEYLFMFVEKNGHFKIRMKSPHTIYLKKRQLDWLFIVVLV